MRQHEKSDVPNVMGSFECRHCGSPWYPQIDNLTCNEREEAGNPVPRARPRSAIDDNDAIHARLVELRAATSATQAASGQPEPAAAPPTSGVDDGAAIFKRITEIRTEHDAAWAAADKPAK